MALFDMVQEALVPTVDNNLSYIMKLGKRMRTHHTMKVFDIGNECPCHEQHRDNATKVIAATEALSMIAGHLNVAKMLEPREKVSSYRGAFESLMDSITS